MKKAYISPKFTVHGNVEAITKAFGSPGAEDTFDNGNGQTFPGSSVGRSGSRSGVLIPAGS
ncbi:hypothetical protein NIES2101_40625 [Calothrix sp. HK-06]|nr:hypothetical protein NIES2101_40625 [Calothrix sp. HK-06]